MRRRILATLTALLTAAAAVDAAGPATGIVFHDVDGDGRFSAGDEPLRGIAVSNGEQIVTTNRQGRFEIPYEADDTVFFVLKPRGWQAPLDENHLPHFYYVHKPAGSPDLDYPGIAPTGPLPERLEFPLYPAMEPDRFQAILFADTQPRDQREVDYIAHDVVEELIGTEATFGVTLGDILFDDLSLFGSLNRTVGLIGIPWHNVVGNHDINFDAPSDFLSNETFRATYGPPYYSFDYGPVHFIVLDDVIWMPADEEQERGRYRGGLDERQLAFLRNDLKRVPMERLVVLFMHIPMTSMDEGERGELFRLLETRPHTMSVSGHTHWQAHRFLGEEEGWRGREPHHHVINVTVSGSWWSGAPDEQGIPHTTMRDGAPNGYSVVTFDGTGYTIDFKAARRPAEHQMTIHAAEVLAAADTNRTVSVNVFGGSRRSIVEMRIGEGEWVTLTRVRTEDPYFRAMKDLEEGDAPPPGRRLPGIRPSDHIWQGRIPADLSPGTHRIEVRAIDMFGRTFVDHRAIRIAAP
jgi:hypothetical protein